MTLLERIEKELNESKPLRKAIIEYKNAVRQLRERS